MGNTDVKGLLDQLGILQESFRALGALPLIEVAWADGGVSAAERRAIRKFARQKGWDSEGGSAAITRWLSQRPEHSYFDEGRSAFLSLAHDRKGLGATIPETSLHAVLTACKQIAETTTFPGWGSAINAPEKAALQRIADHFELGPYRDAIAASPVAKVARGPQGHCLFGAISDFRQDPVGFMTRSWREFGDVLQLRFGPIPVHVFVHPDHVRHVLVDNHRNYQRSAGIWIVKELLGGGLLTSDGEFWRKQRRLAQPAFHMAEPASMASTMAQITQDDLATWAPRDDGQMTVDFAERFRVLTLRIAGITLFNVDLSDESADFGQATTICLKHTTDRSWSMFPLPLSFPTRANRRFLKARAVLDRMIYRFIEDRRSGKATAPRKDLLQMLLDARDPETGQGMSDLELRDELLTMLGAGHETTALALMWACYFIAKHPRVRVKLEREIQQVLGDRVPGIEDIPKMPYTRMVLEEALRLRSPFWLTGRRAITEDSIDGHIIKAGAEIVLAPYLTQRHPGFWENAEQFDPERFTDAKVKERHPHAMFPFGGGPRKCIGINFAMMEMQLVLPMVVRAFDFSLIPGGEPGLDPGLTLRPSGGCPMTTKWR